MRIPVRGCLGPRHPGCGAPRSRGVSSGCRLATICIGSMRQTAPFRNGGPGREGAADARTSAPRPRDSRKSVWFRPQRRPETGPATARINIAKQWRLENPSVPYKVDGIPAAMVEEPSHLVCVGNASAAFGKSCANEAEPTRAAAAGPRQHQGGTPPQPPQSTLGKQRAGRPGARHRAADSRSLSVDGAGCAVERRFGFGREPVPTRPSTTRGLSPRSHRPSPASSPALHWAKTSPMSGRTVPLPRPSRRRDPPTLRSRMVPVPRTARPGPAGVGAAGWSRRYRKGPPKRPPFLVRKDRDGESRKVGEEAVGLA